MAKGNTVSLKLETEKLRTESDKLIESRMNRARRMMDDCGIDALIVTSNDNVRYITGCRTAIASECAYTDFYAALLSLQNDPILMGPAMGLGGQIIGWKGYPLISNQIVANRWARIFADILKDWKLARCNVGVDYLTLPLYSELSEVLPGATLRPALEDLLKTRAIKEEEEIQLEKEAARVVSHGLETMQANLVPGIRENELYATATTAMILEGSEGEPFQQLCSSGERALHTIFPSDRRIKKGELVCADIGCIFGGYVGDCMRTFVAGKNGKTHGEAKALYNSLYQARRKAIEMIEPGIRGSDLDHAIREYLAEAGLPGYPISSGHGVGLRTLELPLIASREDAGDLDPELRPGMIFTLEPRTYKPGVGLVGLEDMFLVTETGHEVLTKAPYMEDFLD